MGRAAREMVGDAEAEEFLNAEEDMRELDKAVAEAMGNLSGMSGYGQQHAPLVLILLAYDNTDISNKLGGDKVQCMAFGGNLPPNSDPENVWFPYGNKIVSGQNYMLPMHSINWQYYCIECSP